MSERLVENAERVRKVDPSPNLDVLSPADTPGRAGKIAETIDRTTTASWNGETWNAEDRWAKWCSIL